jgi:hypothetical protein
MKCAKMTLVLILFAAPIVTAADEKKVNVRDLDKQLFEILKEVHNRGADLYNAGDSSGCYRLFQGSLETARALLNYRPEEQKFIDGVFAEADKEPLHSRRAFILHESIEKLRNRLRTASSKEPPELLTIPPREPKTMPKVRELLPLPRDPNLEKKEPGSKTLAAAKHGVFGHILWKGQPLPGAEITFVSRGAVDIRVFEAVSDSEGLYAIERVRPGRYTVMITATDKKTTLPERYATATTSPLVADLKGGDALDFVLQ